MISTNMAALLRIASRKADTDIGNFKITFLTGTTPASITLGTNYGGPATASEALYDPGDGIWREYTSKTLTIEGDYIEFDGDWRTSSGIYFAMFHATLQSAAYTCEVSGQLGETPSSFGSCYRETFRDCTAVTKIRDNPLPNLAGAPATSMYFRTYMGMTNMTGTLPTGFLDTSALIGAPGTSMVSRVCSSFAASGALPTGFLNLGGLTGTPATSMAAYACSGMSNITSGDILLGSGITFTAANVAGPLTDAFRGMTNWTGRVYWGDDILVDEIDPDAQTNAFTGSTNAAGFATMHPYWKGGTL